MRRFLFVVTVSCCRASFGMVHGAAAVPQLGWLVCIGSDEGWVVTILEEALDQLHSHLHSVCHILALSMLEQHPQGLILLWWRCWMPLMAVSD